MSVGSMRQTPKKTEKSLCKLLEKRVNYTTDGSGRDGYVK